MKLLTSLLLVTTLTVLGACKGTAYSAAAGPMFVAARGQVALQNPGGTLALGDNQIDIDKQLGLADTQAVPYVRLQADNGRHRVRLHGFGMDDTGQGTLTGDFGGLVAGSQVSTTLDFWAIAANYGYELLRDDWYRVAVGGQLGFYALDVVARSALGREEVETNVLVPMPFVEVEGLFGDFTVGANLAIMAADLGDGSGRYLDFETYARWQVVKQFDLMAGYRYIVVDAYGQASSRDFDADMEFRGVFFTAGIKF